MDLQEDYLTKQIITYLGNKRSLLNEINEEIKIVEKKLKKDKLITADLFSGSGIVSRLLKEHSSYIAVNDLELYSKVINYCYLANKNEFDAEEYNKALEKINKKIKKKPIADGIISSNYAPKNDNNIVKGDRCFFTRKNAIYIDSFRYYIDKAPKNLQRFLLAELITEASICNNTCGIFKGFYKDAKTGVGKFGGNGENALNRITKEIEIAQPVLSENICEYEIYMEDSVKLASTIKPKKENIFDLVYLDPPYNQHPYGSNYFMLNLIATNKLDCEISEVAGIPKNWNHSTFNKRQETLQSLEKIIEDVKAKFILVSYNNEGFITYDQMCAMLKKHGTIKIKEIEYNTFRGSRNLRERDLHTREYLFLLEKRK